MENVKIIFWGIIWLRVHCMEIVFEIIHSHLAVKRLGTVLCSEEPQNSFQLLRYAFKIHLKSLSCSFFPNDTNSECSYITVLSGIKTTRAS